MGIYDREYYRRDMRPPPDYTPGRRPGLSLTAWLIIANVVVFFFGFLLTGMRDSPLGKWWIQTFALWPDAVFAKGRVWQLVTSMFLHAGFLHILFNMWFLWLFGKGMERLYGRLNFFLFYIAAGVSASLLFTVTTLLAGEFHYAVGASGGVIGVVVLYAFHYPRQRIYIWGVLPVLVWQLAAFFVGLDLLYFIGGRGGNVAHAAHLGGAAFAVVYRYLDLRIEPMLARLKRRAPKAPRPRAPDGLPPPPRLDPVNPQTRARVDALLDKISRHGLTSLTDEERDFLRNASRDFREDS